MAVGITCGDLSADCSLGPQSSCVTPRSSSNGRGVGPLLLRRALGHGWPTSPSVSMHIITIIIIIK